MNKILVTLLSITMMFSASIAFAQETGGAAANLTFDRPMRNVISTHGEITEVKDGVVRISGEGAYKDIILHVQASTYILNAKDGTAVLLQDLKPGETITAYYGPAVTRSLPPQGSAIALLVGTPNQGSAGMYMKVASLQEGKEGSVRVLCTNNERLVTILPEKLAQISQIKEGSELIVWYDVMTMSIPAQATATKVVLLPQKADLRVNTVAGVIVANQKELTLGTYDVIKNNGQTVMLPLRTIAESLGYRIVWHDENNTVDLEKGGHTITLAVGSTEYRSDNRTIQLQDAPVINYGKALVPVEFFTDVMKLTVEVSNTEGFGL